jgi:DNA repair exonuclease SbcCD ATPase subunit
METNGQTAEAQAIARRKLAAQLGVDEDDAMLPFMQANANLEEKVTLWSSAIVELAELAKHQNQAMQETSQNSLKLMSALRSFEPESAQLQSLIKQLSNSWNRLQAEQDSLPQNLTQALRQELEPILLEIQSAIEQQQQDTMVSDRPEVIAPPPLPSGNTNWQRWFWGAVVVQWVTTLLFVGSGWRWHEQLQSAQQLLYTRSTWTIKKLERIEKALGIMPK